MCGWQVKLCYPSLTRVIPERFRDDSIKCYTNLWILYILYIIQGLGSWHFHSWINANWNIKQMQFLFNIGLTYIIDFSALTHLGIRRSIRPVKYWVMCWHGCLSGVRYKGCAYGPADHTVTPSSLASLKSTMGFTFLVMAYPGCHGKEAIKWLFVRLTYIR